MAEPRRIFDEAPADGPKSAVAESRPPPKATPAPQPKRLPQTLAPAKALKADRPRPVWRTILTTLIIAALVIFIPFLVLRPVQASYRLATWTAAQVGYANFTELTPAVGALISRRVLEVKAAGAGRVRRLLVEEGQAVKQGQLLIEVRNPALIEEQGVATLELETATNAVTEAQAKVQLTQDQILLSQEITQKKLRAAQTELEQIQVLYKIGSEALASVRAAQDRVQLAGIAVSQAKLDAQADIAQAERTLNDAKATLKRNQIKLDAVNAKIAANNVFAAFSGRITELNAVVGQSVSDNEKLLTLVDPAVRKAQLVVDAAKADKLQVGQSVKVAVGTTPLNGTITSIGVQAEKNQNQSSNTIKIEVELEKMVTSFRPNTQVTAEIQTSSRSNVLALKRGPYLATGGGPFVFVVSSNKTRATRRVVDLGDSSTDAVEVLGGLEAGEQVLTSSYDAIKEFPEIELAPTGELK
jgi:HlyD family secretion protein